MSRCLLDTARNLKTPTIKEGVSGSIIVFGNLPQYGDIVFKITPDSNPNTNSLEVERDVYMFIKRVLGQSSPHFAKGLEIGKCDLQTLFDSDNIFFNTIFKAKWKQLRGGAIFQNANSDQILAYEQYFNRNYSKAMKTEFEKNGTYFEKLYEIVYEISSEPRLTHIHYILTSKMNGQSLNDFINENKDFIEKNPRFELDICIQVAQALYAAEQEGFMHNDLHLGNIFIHKLAQLETFNYSIPFEFTLKTKFFITIFDYDFSSYRGGPENTSLTNLYKKTTGASNDYIKNYDWYFFISCFVRALEPIRKTLLRPLIGGTYGQKDPLYGNVGQLSYFGRACLCVEEDKTQTSNTVQRCRKCSIDSQRLNSFISPEDFLNNELKGNPSLSSKKDETKEQAKKNNEILKDQLRGLRPDELVSPSEMLKKYNEEHEKGEDPLIWAKRYQQAKKLETNKFKKKPIVSLSQMGKQTKKKSDLF